MFSTRLDWRTQPNPLSRLLDAKRAAGTRLIDLSESNPTHAGFGQEELLGALVDPRARSYEPHPRGLLRARESVAAYYAERGSRADPERVWLTASTSEAYSFLIKLLADPGCEVLVPRPSYPLLDFLCALDGARVVPYPLVPDAAGWRIDLDAVRERLTPASRAIVVVNPNNPTGSYVRSSDREALLELCEANGLAIIADEVFFDYELIDGTAVPMIAEAAGALIFVVSGISKILALPQMKLGWIVAGGPPALLEDASTYLDLIADTYLSTSAPVLHAVPAWMKSRRAVQVRVRERLRRNLDTLRDLASTAPWEVLPVQGGWYAVLRLGESARPEEVIVLDALEQDNVIVHPGFFFDFDQEGVLVVSLLPAPMEFAEGCRLLARQVR